MSVNRIQGVGWSQDQIGARKYDFLWRNLCARYINTSAHQNQMSGEMRSQMITSSAFAQ